MKKLLVLIVIILLVISSSFAVGDIQCDSDSNDAMDISCGGTNAVSASAARTNLGVSWMHPITKDSPIAATYRWFKADTTLTVTGFDVIEASTDTGSITVDVQECSSTGTGCVSILSAPVTATATGASATISDNSIASGAWVQIVYGTPSGTVSQVASALKGTY